jgi:hypothetical protein
MTNVTQFWTMLIALSLTGCLWATPRSTKSAGYEARGYLGEHTSGAGMYAVGGMAGLDIAAEADVRSGFQRTGDPNRYTGASLGLSLRLSPLGMLATEHQLDRYFDFGGEAGANLTVIPGTPQVSGTGSGWVGAWVELGTVPVGDGYIVLTGTIRAASLDGPWHDQTIYGVGLGYRARSTVTQEDLTWRD